MTVLFPTLQELHRLGSVAAGGPLVIVEFRLLLIMLLHCRVTIDHHAAARDWIAGTIAANSPRSADEGGFALRAYQPFAWRVYPPTAAP